jgi:hypothetical protein
VGFFITEKRKRKRGAFLRLFSADKLYRLNSLSVTATAENYHDSKNDYPCTVIVEDVTKAVVIHYSPSVE